jgi:hypothetical protein
VGDRHVVGGRDVVRLGGERVLEERHRLGEPALLQVDLAEMDACAGVRRIDLDDPSERLHRLVELVFGPGSQAAHEVRVR